MKDPFIYIPEIMELSFSPENEITTPTEFKVVEFDSTNPGINTDEGFFFFNLKTKHCGEFFYRTFNKKAFVDFGNQLEKNHKGPYRIEVIKDTIYICSTPELYDPAIHETQNNPNAQNPILRENRELKDKFDKIKEWVKDNVYEDGCIDCDFTETDKLLDILKEK